MGNLINIVGGPLIAAILLRFTDEGIRLWLWIMMMRSLNSLSGIEPAVQKNTRANRFIIKTDSLISAWGMTREGAHYLWAREQHSKLHPKIKTRKLALAGGERWWTETEKESHTISSVW